jgi:hypothetical protein
VPFYCVSHTEVVLCLVLLKDRCFFLCLLACVLLGTELVPLCNNDSYMHIFDAEAEIAIYSQFLKNSKRGTSIQILLIATQTNSLIV